MKNTIILAFIILLFESCAMQKPRGLFLDEESGCFACINQDSISIGYKRESTEKGLVYYYGKYSLEQDKIILSNNELRYDNMVIEESFSDYSGIEIQLYEQQKYFVFGAPTTIDSTFYQLSNRVEVYFSFDPFYKDIFMQRRKPDAKTTNGLIQIPMKDFHTNNSNNIEFFIIGCYNFFSEVRITATPHTHYVIKQKSLYNRPMIPQEVPIVYNPGKKQIEIKESSSTNYQPHQTFQLKRIGKSTSCLGELRKRYPDL